MLEQIAVALLDSLVIGIALARLNFSQANMETPMNVAERVAWVVNLLLCLALIKAVVHQLQVGLHELSCIGLGV